MSADHQRLHLPPLQDPPIDLEIAHKAQEALRQGRMFAHQCLLPMPRPPKFSRHLRESTGALRQMAQSDQGGFLLLRSFFMRGAAWEVLHTPTYHAALKRAWIIQIMSQQQLVRALLLLPLTTRERLWGEQADHLLNIAHAQENWDWKIQHAGAMAVARTAYALLSRQWTVFLPTPYEQLKLNLVLLARSQDDAQGMCLRIHSNGTQSFSTYEVAERERNRQETQAQNTKDLLASVEAFNRFYGTAWLAVSLEVGLSGEQASAVETCASPHELIWHSLIPEYFPSESSPNETCVADPFSAAVSQL